MKNKKIIYTIILLVSYFFVFLPKQSNAAILEKSYSGLAQYGRLCACDIMDGQWFPYNKVVTCSVMFTPSGIDCVYGICCNNDYKSVLKNIGSSQNLLERVKEGSGCVDIVDWSPTYKNVKFNCHVPVIEEQCVCLRTSLSGAYGTYECQKKFVSDKKVFGDYYKIFDELSVQNCPAKYTASTKSTCCCKDVGIGELNQKRECKIVAGDLCNKGIFEGVFGITPDLTSVAEPGYQTFEIDSSKGCASYEKVESEYKGTASGSSIGDLKKEAAEALNQMKFKTGTAGINDLIGRAISFLTMAIGSLLLLFYVYAGILWMTAMGNSERTGKAKQIVVWSTLGVIVVLASYAIIKFVFSVVG